MKLALPLILLFVSIISFEVNAQGSFMSAISPIKANQQPKQQLRVKNSRQAANIAKSRFGGKVLKVQKKNSGYRVKLIKTDGHIVSIYIDARSGQVSGGF